MEDLEGIRVAGQGVPLIARLFYSHWWFYRYFYRQWDEE
jgi:hypothetical protein